MLEDELIKTEAKYYNNHHYGEGNE